MTFRQFQLTGMAVADLAAIPECAAQGASGPGRVYADCGLYIEGAERSGAERSGYCLTIGNDSRIDKLEILERRLYDWAVGEGYITPTVEVQP